MLNEYRPQCILVTLHSALIIGGSMATAAVLRAFERDDLRPQEGFFLWLVRNWGFCLILLPLVWAVATITLKRRRWINFSKRYTVLSGILLLVGLALFFFMICGRAGCIMVMRK